MRGLKNLKTVKVDWVGYFLRLLRRPHEKSVCEIVSGIKLNSYSYQDVFVRLSMTFKSPILCLAEFDNDR